MIPTPESAPRRGKKVLDNLRIALDLTDADVDTLIRKDKGLENAKIMNTADPSMEFLRTRLALSTPELRKMVLALPQVFSYSVENNMEPKLEYLEKRLSLDPDQLRNFIVTSSAVFAFKIESMERNMKYFETRFSFTKEEVLSLLSTQTSLMAYDIETNIEPTIDFFESLLGSEQGLALIKWHPALLGASLSKRLIPRRERMISVGVVFDDMNAKRMCYKTNDQFEKWLEDITPIS